MPNSEPFSLFLYAIFNDGRHVFKSSCGSVELSRFSGRFNGLFRYTHLIELSEAPLMKTKTNKNKLRYSKRLSVIGNLSYLLVLSSYFITEKLSLFFHAEANTKKAGCKPVPNGYLQPAFAIN